MEEPGSRRGTRGRGRLGVPRLGGSDGGGCGGLSHAVCHARTPGGRQVETRFQRQADAVRIEVHDASEELPTPRVLTADAVDGRGLALVATLTDSWGVSGRDGVGKVVWAVVSSPHGDGEA
ncbi:ATP-binding protein [Streptomyces sp. NPDC002055]|uniref:ATP-binding protein n=1 Tax=Streptomyces sp. NPDC002055 TaxID=3154534 RepID=UPI00332C5211